MYPVSKEYRSSMKQQIRNNFKINADMYTVVPEIQSGLKIVSQSGMIINNRTSLFELERIKKTTSFDNDYMRCDGSYYPLDDFAFTTSSVSSSELSSNGDYEFANECFYIPKSSLLNKDFWFILITEGISRVKIRYMLNNQQVAELDGDKSIYDSVTQDVASYIDSEANMNYDNIKIEILASEEPNRKGYIKKVEQCAYECDHEKTFTGNDNKIAMTSQLSSATINETYNDYEFDKYPSISIGDYNNHINVKDIGFAFLTEGISRARVTYKNFKTSCVKEVKISDGENIFVSTEGYSFIDFNHVIIEIISTYKPNHRAKIFKIVYGKHTLLTDSDILSLKYVEDNDCVCLECPEKKLEVCIDNHNQKYSEEKELLNPQFIQGLTQIVTTISYDTLGNEIYEPVELGRLFLKDYDVNQQQVKFNFEDALGLLSKYLHKWCAVRKCSPKFRFDEVINMQDYSAKLWEVKGDSFYYVKSPGQLYGLKYITDLTDAKYYKEMIYVPLVNQNEALQLIANRYNKLLRAGRKVDLECFAKDNSVKSHISVDEMFNFPSLKKTEKISSIEVEVNDFHFKQEDENNEQQNYQVEEDKICNAEICSRPTEILNENIIIYCSVGSKSFPNAKSVGEGSDGSYAKHLGHFMHAAYFTNLEASPPNIPEFSRGTYNISFCEQSFDQTTVKFNYDTAGETLKVKNPMYVRSYPLDYINKSRWEKPTLAKDVADNLYNELKNNITATISHRGFPELDCGDVIEFDTKDMKNNKGRIINNEFTIKSGAMTGSTKVRWLYA